MIGIETNIRKYRKQKNLKQSDLAELVGIRREEIQKIECGYVLPRLPVCFKLSIVLETSIENLFKDTYAVCCINVDSVKERLKKEDENVNS